MIANKNITHLLQRGQVIIECESCPTQIHIPLSDWQEPCDPRTEAGWCQVRNLAKQYEDYCPDCSTLHGFGPVIDEALLFGKPADTKRDRDNLCPLYAKGDHS